VSGPAGPAIPRVFHQIWVGPDPFPDEFLPYQQSWLEHNPGWQLRLWTEDTLPEHARRPEIFEQLRNPAERSDILRFELLWQHGGIYTDCDFECLRPIEPLLDEVRFFAGYRKPGHLSNAILGATPHHPLVDRALDQIRPRTTYGTLDKDGTGPTFLDRLIATDPTATLFDHTVFYPRTLDQRRTAHAVHHGEQSSRDVEELRSSVGSAYDRLQRATEDARVSRERARRAEAELARARASLPLARLARLLRR
jgi:inositol phosphorylceramide mannosyltransferase catalytic subunit